MLSEAIIENKSAILAGAFLSLFLVSAIPLPTHAATGGLFNVTIIAPGNANPARREWGAIIANSFTNVGINAREVFLPWGTVYARVLTPDLSVRGKTFDAGGYDLQLVGYTPAFAPIGAEFSNFDSSQFAPSSGNYYLWANSTADTLIRSAIGAGYTSAGITALKNWERVEYTDRPEIPIEFDIANYATNPGLNYHGWEGYYANAGPLPQFVSYGSKTSMTVGSTGDFENMLPLLSSSYYDLEAYFPVFDSLFLTTYPVGYPNNPPNAASQIIPDLATGVQISSDGRTLTYSLRTANWQDGTPFTADDVLFTFLAYTDYNTGSLSDALLTSYLGNDVTFKWLNGTSTHLVNDNVKGISWYGPSSATPGIPPDSPARTASVVATDAHTVTITLGNFQGLSTPAATFHQEISASSTFEIMPGKYLTSISAGCLSASTTTVCGWGSSEFNTATATPYTSNGVTFKGPFGTGPYSFVGYDAVNAVVHLKKNAGYWNATALQNSGEFTLTDYYLKYISDTSGAISALKNGDIDAIDPQYHYNPQVAAGQLSFAKVYREPLAGQQEVGVNMQNPVFGTGVQTPAGQANPAKAATAARAIRQAFDYLIPRDLIISNLLLGSSQPGDVPFAFGAYKDSSLTARPYDPSKALSLLASAGYKTIGITPIVVNPPSIPSFILGSAIPVTGSFANPTTGAPYATFVVLIQTSPDNKTWTNNAQVSTDLSGNYQSFFVPTNTGTYYVRAHFTGITVATAGTEFAQRVGGGKQINYTGITPTAAPADSTPFSVTVGTLGDLLKQYASSSGLQAANTQITSLQTANTNLSAQLTSLQGQISTLTTVAYGAIAIAIIVGIAGFLFARRKPS